MIVPGSPNALLLAHAADPLDELGKIDRSLRSRASAAPYLSWTPAVAGNRTVWTWFGWLKPSQITEMVLFLAGGTSQNFSMLAMASSGALRTTTKISDVYSTDLYTDALFRDPSGHYHIIINRNGTLNRVYVNGVLVDEITSSASNSFFNSVTAHYIGRRPFLSNSPVDGYLSHCGWVDGQALPPSAFGQFHPRTGQWRPKTKAAIRAAVAAGGGTRNGWGANGFFLPFDDVSSVSALGYDRSQGDTDTTGNNWTPNNISLTAGATYDSMLDTPTNNYATLNPIMIESSIYGVSLASNGNLTQNSVATNYDQTIATLGVSSGKWYWEVTYTAGSDVQNFVGVRSSPNLVSAELQRNGVVVGMSGASLPAWENGTVIGVALNCDGGTIAFYYNGVLQNAARSITGLTPGSVLFPVQGNQIHTANVNFGQQGFTYAPPSGFKSLCTKNLPVNYPVMKGESAFVARVDTGSNIAATLSAAAPWSDWIRIYKRRDAAEGWRWQFSDDAGYYMDSVTNAAKAAFPVLSGTSYVGFALRVAARFGIATGRLTHVNGVADVVADGLSKIRKMVILKNESAGVWYVYHPDLTAGKLLYFDQSAETTDATISAVTSSGFTVAAALASGTYRWVAIAEVEGFIKLSKYTGNGAVDGPFVHTNGRSGFDLVKRISAATENWTQWDDSRTPNNVAAETGYLNQTSGTGDNSADRNSNGLKIRATSASQVNTGSAAYVGLHIAAFPFRYANAR